jgi:hypothetical protein
MGNTWSYEIVLQDGQYVTPDLLKHILSLASSMDYNLRFPTYVINRDGMDELQFFDADSLIEYMSSQGGCFTIWDEADDDMLITIIPPTREFSFGVQYNLYEDRNQKNAHDLEQFFDILCRDLKPHFAYSQAEWTWEAAFPGLEVLTAFEKFHKSILKGELPLVLCWLTYMDKAYFERIPKATLEGVEFYRLTETEHGVFIQLADQPWNAVNVMLQNGKYDFFFRY